MHKYSPSKERKEWKVDDDHPAQILPIIERILLLQVLGAF
jgi:hypothetical protein